MTIKLIKLNHRQITIMWKIGLDLIFVTGFDTLYWYSWQIRNVICLLNCQTWYSMSRALWRPYHWWFISSGYKINWSKPYFMGFSSPSTTYSSSTDLYITSIGLDCLMIAKFHFARKLWKLIHAENRTILIWCLL